jgi:hypothetical protein
MGWILLLCSKFGFYDAQSSCANDSGATLYVLTLKFKLILWLWYVKFRPIDAFCFHRSNVDDPFYVLVIYKHIAVDAVRGGARNASTRFDVCQLTSTPGDSFQIRSGHTNNGATNDHLQKPKAYLCAISNWILRKTFRLLYRK